MSEERKAIYYGQVELISGVLCDAYVLDDNTTVMSERGTADLLGMHHKSLQNVAVNWPPETLKPFISNDFSVAVNSVEVIAENSPHKGRKITVYTAETIETLISGYALAFAYDALRENQRHIGKRCVILLKALVRTVLGAAIEEACGLQTHIQQTAQKNYVDIIKLVRETGLKCSVEGDIVTKKDLLEFLGITMGKLNSHLRKHREYVKTIPLSYREIRATGSKASRMNGYSIADAVKIILGMDSVPGIEIKAQLLGPLGIFVKPDTSKEIHWKASLSTAFDGFDFHHNHPLGRYRVDFVIVIGDLKIALECNGYEHHYYNVERERKREEFITQGYGLVRFDHNIGWEKLINAILRVKPGEIIRLT